MTPPASVAQQLVAACTHTLRIQNWEGYRPPPENGACAPCITQGMAAQEQRIVTTQTGFHDCIAVQHEVARLRGMLAQAIGFCVAFREDCDHALDHPEVGHLFAKLTAALSPPPAPTEGATEPKPEAYGFEKELAALINRYSRENGSNTPDFILASFLADALEAYDVAVRQRGEWYGRHDEPGSCRPKEPHPEEAGPDDEGSQ